MRKGKNDWACPFLSYVSTKIAKYGGPGIRGLGKCHRTVRVVIPKFVKKKSLAKIFIIQNLEKMVQQSDVLQRFLADTKFLNSFSESERLKISKILVSLLEISLYNVDGS